MSGPVRVLVVEDSRTVRQVVVEALSASPDVRVVGEAGDGARAVELCRALRPDVVALDIVMPVMNGLEATERIMADCATPIVIVSGSENRGELFDTLDALAAGAVDVLDKPRGDEDDAVWEERLVSTVKRAARIKVITHIRPKRSVATSPSPSPSPTTSTSTCPTSGIRLIAIGASTGGPRAVMDLLAALPADFPIPILLVIHVGSGAVTAFAEWLDGNSPIRVREARDGEPLPPVGVPLVVMAPPDRHLFIAGGRLRLGDGPERHGCRPAVDVLFESVAREVGAGAAACLLTGMGKDGAAGLLAVRRAGGVTLAQDEATSAVFGMPREAILLGGAEQVLPIAEFAPSLVRLGGAREVHG